MKKEIIICLLIIILVCILNYITSAYTQNSVEIMNESLNIIKYKIYENEDVSVEIKKIKDFWEERNKKLAYYIEHDELEKVYVYIVEIESSLNSQQYEDSIKELDKCVYTLQHINDKYSFSLENIF